MDTLPGGVPSHPGGPIKPGQALANLRAFFDEKLRELEASIPLWGVRLDHPEGKFIRSQIESQRAIADMIVFQAQHSFRVQSELSLVESQLRSSVQTVEAAMKSRVSEIKGDVDHMITESISSFGKRLANETSRWRYIREAKWNLRQNLMGVLALTVLAACLVYFGFCWRTWDDTYAMRGTWECEHGGAVAVTTPDGPFLACPLYRLVDPGTIAGMDKEFLPPSKK